MTSICFDLSLLDILKLEYALVWLHFHILGAIKNKHLGVCTDDLQLELLFCLRLRKLALGRLTTATAKCLGCARELRPGPTSSLCHPSDSF